MYAIRSYYEIAIVVRIFLRAHGPGFDFHRVEQAGFLLHLATALEDLDLAARLVFDGLLDEAERVHVLQLAARAEMAEVARFAESYNFV